MGSPTPRGPAPRVRGALKTHTVGVSYTTHTLVGVSYNTHIWRASACAKEFVEAGSFHFPPFPAPSLEKCSVPVFVIVMVWILWNIPIKS